MDLTSFEWTIMKWNSLFCMNSSIHLSFSFSFSRHPHVGSKMHLYESVFSYISENNPGNRVTSYTADICIYFVSYFFLQLDDISPFVQSKVWASTALQFRPAAARSRGRGPRRISRPSAWPSVCPRRCSNSLFSRREERQLRTPVNNFE